MGKVPSFKYTDYHREIIFIGHFAHWRKSEILELTEDELLAEYNVCVELHNEINTPVESEE